MANKFWVGNAGTWDASTTTHWSDTSGGAGGATAPTSADDVKFDASSITSGSQVITIGSDAVCKSINFTGCLNNPDLAVATTLTVSGSITFIAAMSTSGIGSIDIDATCTLTTNALVVACGYITGIVGSNITLADNLEIANFCMLGGAFNSAGFTIVCEDFELYDDCTVDISGSTITISGGMDYCCIQGGVDVIATGATISTSATGSLEIDDFYVTGLQNTITGGTFAIDAATSVGVIKDTTFTGVTVTGITLDATDPTNINGTGNTGIEFSPAMTGSSTLPMLTIEASIGCWGDMSATMPRFTSSGKCGQRIFGTFTAAAISSSAVQGALVNASVTLPELTITGTIFSGMMVSLESNLPAITGTMTVYDVPVGTLDSTIPSLTLYSLASNTIATVGLCLNTEISAISVYTGWLFNSMCVFNSTIIMASTSGIFTHTGDKDGVNNIDAYFTPFHTDLGTTQQKRIRNIVVEGDLESSLQLTTIFDQASATAYSVNCPPVLTACQSVVATNYTDNGVLVGYKIANVNGSDFAIDTISALIMPIVVKPKQYRIVARLNQTFPAMTIAGS